MPLWSRSVHPALCGVGKRGGGGRTAKGGGEAGRRGKGLGGGLGGVCTVGKGMSGQVFGLDWGGLPVRLIECQKRGNGGVRRPESSFSVFNGAALASTADQEGPGPRSMWCSLHVQRGVDDDWKAVQTASSTQSQGLDPEKMCNTSSFRSCRAWRTSVDGDQVWATAQQPRIGSPGT